MEFAIRHCTYQSLGIVSSKKKKKNSIRKPPKQASCVKESEAAKSRRRSQALKEANKERRPNGNMAIHPHKRTVEHHIVSPKASGWIPKSRSTVDTEESLQRNAMLPK